jgi:hypothetical protein
MMRLLTETAMRHAMLHNTRLRTSARALTLATLLGTTAFGAQAYGGGHHGYGHWGGHGRGHVYYGGGWGLGVGIGLGLLLAPPLIYGPPAPVVIYSEPLPPPPAPSAVIVPSAPAYGARPDPVIYPRNGQSAEQTEADRQACNRWATTQQAAMADASIFQRAVEACMDARGYTLR